MKNYTQKMLKFSMFGFFLIQFILIEKVSSQTLLSGMPQVNDEIYAIVRSGNTVYIGGAFTTVGGFKRNHLAAFNANTGEVLPWAPDPDDKVLTLLIAEGKLLVGGNFLNINGTARKFLAGFRLSDLTMDNSIPITNSRTQDLKYYGGKVYFPIVNTSNFEKQITRFTLATGTVDSWRTETFDSAITLYFDINGNYIYVGGDFSSVNNKGQGYFARLDLNTGNYDATKSYVFQSISLQIKKVIAYNSNVYVGGNFSNFNGTSTKGIVQIDSNGDVTTTDYFCSGSMTNAIFPQKQTLWLGGNSYSIGYGSSYRISQVDINSGYANCWTTNEFRTVSWILSIHVQGDTVYTGSTVNSSSDNSLKVIIGNPNYMDLGPDKTISAGQSISLNATKTLNSDYSWYKGSTSLNLNTPTITVTAPGLYSVLIMDPNYCFAKDTIQIFSNVLTEVESENKEVNLVYPNPASNYINMSDIWGKSHINWQLFDNFSRKILEGTYKSPNTIIDVSTIDNGNYLMKVTWSDNGESKIFRVAIVK